MQSLSFHLSGGDQSWLQTYYTHTTIDGFRFTIKYSREKSDLCLIGSVPSSLSYKTFLFFPYFHISFNNWKNKYILDHFLHGLSFGPDGRLCQLLWRQTFFHFEILFFLSFWRERFILTIDCLCLATRERNHSLGRFRGKKYQKFSELQKICKYILNQLCNKHLFRRVLFRLGKLTVKSKSFWVSFYSKTSSDPLLE